MEKEFKIKMTSDSVCLQGNKSSSLVDHSKSKSEINGGIKKRRADQAVALVPNDGDNRRRIMDPTIRWKLMEQRGKRRKSCALKSALDQPKKKQVSSGSSTKRTLDFKAMSSQGISLISTTTGGIQKINNDRKNTCPNSSSSSRDLSGDLVFCCNNKLLNNDDTQVIKKALSAARLTSRYAEIFFKAKAGKSNLEAAQIREAEQLKKKEVADLREKQREAARIALELVEKTVEFEDNLMIIKELEILSQCSPTYIRRGRCNGPVVMMLRGLAPGSKVFNPLEQLGLYMKEEEFMTADEEEAFLGREVEEGEIVKY